MKEQTSRPMTKLDEHQIWNLICEIESRAGLVRGKGMTISASAFGQTATALLRPAFLQRIESMNLTWQTK